MHLPSHNIKQCSMRHYNCFPIWWMHAKKPVMIKQILPQYICQTMLLNFYHVARWRFGDNEYTVIKK